MLHPPGQCSGERPLLDPPRQAGPVPIGSPRKASFHLVLPSQVLPNNCTLSCREPPHTHSSRAGQQLYSLNSKQTPSVKGAPSRSCHTGSQSRGHPSRVGGLFPHSCQSSILQVGITASHSLESWCTLYKFYTEENLLKKETNCSESV